MKTGFLTVALAFPLSLHAGVEIDIARFGDSLGGWKKRDKTLTVDYPYAGSEYRTYKPEITPTPDNGIFVTVRIDHRRGFFQSNDHAVLEVTYSSDGSVASAQSSIALQGRIITSDLIRIGTSAGAKLNAVDRAVKIGSDLVADLSSKILREKAVEAGRVSFPAALRHNYNLLYRAIRVIPEAVEVDPLPALPAPEQPPEPEEPREPEEKIPEAEDPETTKPDHTPSEPQDPSTPDLEIKPYGASGES